MKKKVKIQVSRGIIEKGRYGNTIVITHVKAIDPETEKYIKFINCTEEIIELLKSVTFDYELEI